MHTMTEAEYQAGSNSSEGICIRCGAVHDGVEPDAENYTCEVCGSNSVAGLEQARLIGELAIKEEE